ncbi:MAG TPA: aminotransferase class V-fold PLP-dependent enzyme [Longimicrobiaceae bacterium]|jgi:selenocysteine lyase/cysteine desulfurase|nr:aminotransferase class V-fold PLP-dependent enzyme [Longimicrobiaceae bacterium]
MSDTFSALRATEFARLDAGGHVYLDYTGSGLYAESQVRAHAQMLTSSVFGNPHSRNPTSLAATALVEEVRDRVHAYFQADPAEYEVIFTLNASHALKLVGESFGFEAGSRYVLTADNHNSVNGIREYAHCRDAEVRYVPLDADLRIADVHRHLEGADPEKANLFVFPAQSNFSGVKHPLEWIADAQSLGYDVLLDAAAYVPTSPLSLAEVKPDFVCVSFYKMFGFPTGVGALLARTDALHRLHRPWFGGGTVRFVSASSEVTMMHTTGRGFEDGTLNFLSIAAVRDGLDFVEGIGIERINAHVMALAEGLLAELKGMTHSGGAPMVRIYGPCTTEGRGATVAFNLLDPDGHVVDFKEVEERSSAAGVSLRTGYFCNPGAAEFAFEHADAEVSRCFGSMVPDFSLQRFSVCLNHKPVGAVRVSLGIASNEADVRALLAILEGFRDAHVPAPDEAMATA